MKTALSAPSLLSSGVFLALLSGCGGGIPLLHPARALPSGDVRMAGGISANIAPGSLGNSLDNARNIAATDPNAPGAPGTNTAYAKGALVAAAIGPGLAPFVAARVGIGNNYEAGLAYTGRAVRLDMRKAFDRGNVSYSAGLGLSAALYGRQNGTELSAVDLGALHGYGGDIPLLIGWESAGGLYKVWGGARGGYEHVIVSTETSEPKDIPLGAVPIRLEADRFWGGAVVGIGTGFRHVHVALELDVAYQSITGRYNDTKATVGGITLAPATALWFSF